MSNPATNLPPISDRSGVTDAVRAQILATEHWSLLATRGLTWNEIFTRAGMYITLLSASVVALALVAQATGFGTQFRIFALLILPVVLLMGFASFVRLCDANLDDVGLLVAMNRLRHAYLELAPELKPYFTTGQHDDMMGIMQSMGFSAVLASTPNVQQPLTNDTHKEITSPAPEKGTESPVTVVSILIGIAAALGVGFVEARYSLRLTDRAISSHHPRFPR